VPLLRTRLALALVLLSPVVVLDHAAAAPPKVAVKKPSPTAREKPGLSPVSARHGTTANLAAAASPARAPAGGKSVGSPTEGRLVGGVHLATSPYLRIVPAYAGGDVRWGIEPLVGLIDRAAKSVRAKFPDAVLSVGHLSKPGGGELDRHASHESGRDADIAFYVKNQAGKPIYADHFVAFDGDGNAKSWPGAKFDDARNWALVAAIVSDTRAHVTHVFVATPIRARLLAYAERMGAPPALRARAAELMAQPKGSLPHDDHFHVRVGCPAGMEQCIEQPIRRHHGAASAGAHDHAQGHGHASGHVASAPPPHAAPPHAAPAPPPAPKRSDKNDNESAKSDSSVPSLAQPVPGLDSAVIPAPLAKPTWGTAKEPAKPAPSDPISDPDGVLDGH
jgi:penicillin-insensitive murein endopeptidase